MNIFWFFLMTLSSLFALISGTTEQTEAALFAAVDDAVSLAVRLLGLMAFWSGMMHILKESGAMEKVSALLSPLLKLLFPDSFRHAETRNAMASNIAANLLGLGNAATPLGLRAMRLFKNSSEAGLFVLLNTTGFCLLPTTILSLRTQAGAAHPSSVIPLIWLTSLLSVLFAVTLGKITGGRKK